MSNYAVAAARERPSLIMPARRRAGGRTAAEGRGTLRTEGGPMRGVRRTGGIRRTWSAALGCGAAILFAGCPYSGVPLGDPDATAFEVGLVGEWTLLADSAEPDSSPGTCSDSTVTLLRFNRAEYLVSARNMECRLDNIRAFPTRVGDALFLNIEDEPLSPDRTEDATRYSVARADLHGDDMLLRFVSETIGSPRTPAQLRELLHRRLDDPSIYEAETYRLRRR